MCRMEKIILLTLVTVFTLSYSLQRSNGNNSEGSGTCSYWYNSSPLSLKCSHGERVELACTVYAPKAPQVGVRWYFTVKEGDELNDGTQIAPADYFLQNQFLYQYSPTNESSFTGLFYGVSTLVVTVFSEKLAGYYWCQMVIGESLIIALDPSEPAFLRAGGDVGMGCVKTGMTPTQPKCVDPKSGPIVKRAEMMTPTTTCEFGSTLKEVSNHSCIPSPTPNSTARGQCTVRETSCFVYVGVSIGIVAVCLGIFITATVCIVSRSRRNDIQQSSEDEDDHYSYTEMPREAHYRKRLPGSEESYQSLSLAGTDYTHMYSRTTPPVGSGTIAADFRAAGQEYGDERVYAVPGQRTLNEARITAERAGRMYTAINPINFEPSNQYTQLHSQHETVL